jgi:CheY-like chemotaxis protein
MKSKDSSPLVLVADRDEMERAQLRAILKFRGFRVIEAGDGPAAIELAIAEVPDLLLLDLKLPRLRSSEAIWKIRQEPKLHKLPIVAVSANHTGRIPLDSLTVHASRPIEFSVLDSFLSRFLPPQPVRVSMNQMVLAEN